MAVKRTNQKVAKPETENPEVNVDVTPDAAPDSAEETKKPDAPDTDDGGTQDADDSAKDEDNSVKVEVNTDTPDTINIPDVKSVRVRMKVDVKFNFGGELYDLKKGQCYNLPPAVKLHLNGKEALLPL